MCSLTSATILSIKYTIVSRQLSLPVDPLLKRTVFLQILHDKK